MLRNKFLLNRRLLLLIALCFMQSSASYAQLEAARSQRVNKIFIAPVPYIKELGIGPVLETELERQGFEVVSRISDADAVVSLVSAKEVATTEYDVANIPNTTSDSFYRFEITTPNKGIIWKIRLKLGTTGVTAENRYVARRVAEKMAQRFKDK